MSDLEAIKAWHVKSANEASEALLAKAMRKQAARKRQAMGDASEHLVAARLRALGLLLIEKQATPMVKVRGQWIHAKRTSGDFKAVSPGGRAVIVEVKRRPLKLSIADFQKHQLASLQAYHDAGAVALIAWHSDAGIFVLPFDCRPVERIPLTIKDAEQFNLRMCP